MNLPLAIHTKGVSVVHPRTPYLCRLLLAANVLSSCGGCFIRPAAETILTATTADNLNGAGVKFGVRKVRQLAQGGKMIIIGSGGHPREHETYAFFINEPFPPYQPRSIRITCDVAELDTGKARCKIEFLYGGSLLQKIGLRPEIWYDLFVGHAQLRVRARWGKYYLGLEDVELAMVGNPRKVMQLSGRVVARRASVEKFLLYWTMFEGMVAVSQSSEPQGWRWPWVGESTTQGASNPDAQ